MDLVARSRDLVGEAQVGIDFPVAATALVAVRSTGDALQVLQTVQRRFDRLEAAEYFHDDGLRLVLRHRELASPFGRPYPVYLLLEVAGSDGDAVEDLAEALEQIDEVRDAVLAGTATDRRRLWELLEGHTGAISAAGVPVQLDVALPLDRLGAFEQQLPDVVRPVSPHCVPILFGHIAEGNVHVNLLEAEEDDVDGAVSDAVLRLVAELGGSLSAEHGIGLARRHRLPLTRSAAGIAGSILSPGRILPPAPDS